MFQISILLFVVYFNQYFSVFCSFICKGEGKEEKSDIQMVGGSSTPAGMFLANSRQVAV